MTRDLINQRVKDYSVQIQEHPKLVWTMFYSAMRDRIWRRTYPRRDIDLKREAEKRGIDRLAYIESLGLLDEAWELAQDLFQIKCREGA